MFMSLTFGIYLRILLLFMCFHVDICLLHLVHLFLYLRLQVWFMGENSHISVEFDNVSVYF